MLLYCTGRITINKHRAFNITRVRFMNFLSTEFLSSWAKYSQSDILTLAASKEGPTEKNGQLSL